MIQRCIQQTMKKNVAGERFIRTLKNKIYKHMSAVSKNVYIDKLNDIVNEYNNTCHRTIKMKPADIKDNTYIDFSKEVHDKDAEFKVGDHVISKYKKIYRDILSVILMEKKVLEYFMKKNCKNKSRRIYDRKKKGNKLYAKWIGHDH